MSYYNYFLSVSLLYISLYFTFINSKDLFISNENCSNGTSTNTYATIIQAILDDSENNIDLNITILTNSPSIIDIAMNLNFNLYIHAQKDKQIVPSIQFASEGCFKLTGNYTLILENIRFEINRTIKYFPYSAFYVENPFKLFFYECEFTNNYGLNATFLSVSNGNLIHMIRSKFSSLIFENGRLINITKSKVLLIEDCYFSNITNKKDYLIFSLESKLEIRNSIFRDNTIEKIYSKNNISMIRAGSEISFHTIVFKNNLMRSTPILLIENDANLKIFANFSNLIFDSNIQRGGTELGVSLNGNFIRILMNDVIFIHNIALQGLMSFYHSLEVFETRNLFFLNNFASNMVKVNLAKYLNILTMKCILNNNHQYNENMKYINLKSGNCFTAIDYEFINLTNCLISNNYAASALTGIHLEHTNAINSLFEDKNNSNLQAIFQNFECSNNIIEIHNETTKGSGNCIFLNNLGSITLFNCNFTANLNKPISSENRKYGGNPCLISYSKTNSLYIYDSYFKQNQAHTQCSCLNFYGKNIIIANSFFIENQGIKLLNEDLSSRFSIESEGGCLNLGAENITIKDVIIFNSSAMKGAGIFFHNRFGRSFQNLVAINLTIMKNEGIQTSGMEFDSTLLNGNYYFLGCAFIENKVDFFGVISSFYSTDFNLFFFSNNISYNWGISAGAAFSFCHFAGNVFINDTIFIGNVLSKSPFIGGAALFVYGFCTTTYVYIKNCTFLENFSSLKGGAIQVAYGKIYIKNSTFIDNYAMIGGALSVTVFSSGTLENSIIRSKFIVNQGGGVHLQDFAFVNITNTIFFDCEARKGGGIYVSGSEMSFFFANLSFFNVKAEDGCAIWFKNSNSPLIIFENLYVELSKGIISGIFFIDSSNIIVKNLSLTNNNGRIFSASNSTLKLMGIEIKSHICKGVNYLGCAMFCQKSSIELSNILLENVVSNFIEDAFAIYYSSIVIESITILDFKSVSKTLLLTSLSSFILLKSSFFANLNNSLIEATNCELKIFYCEFMNITSKTNYGIIKIIMSFIFLLTNSNFQRISGKFGGVLTILEGTNGLIANLTNIVFEKCLAENGAAVYLFDQSLIVSNCTFRNGIAKYAGGAIYFDCNEEKQYKWLISNSNFLNNTAIKGGAYHSNQYMPKYDIYCIFFNNTAIYGPDFSAFPIKLSLQIGEKTIDCENEPAFCYLRENITSGQTLPPIIINVLDFYDQKITELDSLAFAGVSNSHDNYFENYSESQFAFRDNIIFEGVGTQKLINGSYNFSEIGIISQPPSNVWLSVKADCINKYYSDFLPKSSYFHRKDKNTGSYYFALKIFLRDCIPGEIYSNNKTKCIPCLKGKYSFTKFDKNCKMCPRTVECDGRASFKLKPGYWRNSNISDEIYQCLQITESCLGGESSSCLNGYTGVLCGACEYHQNRKFFKKALYYCEECQSVWIYILTVIAVLIIIIIFILFLIASKKGNSFENVVLVKIMMNHIQTVSFLANIKVELPSFLVGFSGVQAPICSFDSMVFTLECFKDETKMSNFVMKLVFSVIVMITIILILTTFYSLYGIYKKKDKKFILESLFNAFVIVGSFFQPSFINFYVQNVSCDKIGSAHYLTFNLEQECWDKMHTFYSIFMIVPALFFWMIIFPLIFLVYMIINRKDLKNQKVFKITKFFQAGYEENCFYWEFIQMSRKFFVILLTTFLRSKPQAIIYVLVPVITFYLILQIIVMPYQKEFKFNLLEILSLNACFITYYFVIFYIKSNGEGEKIFSLVTIIIFNFIFFLVWIGNYFVFLKRKINYAIKNFSFMKRSSVFKKKNGKSNSVQINFVLK